MNNNLFKAKLSKRDFLKISAAAAACLAFGANRHTASASSLPASQGEFGATLAESPWNFLFIITDQLTASAMSCSGNSYVRTPNIDRIASRGMRFTKSFCTYPLCTPARASLFTSRMPHELGITGNVQGLPASVPSMGPLFSAAGYDTAYAGKWHLPIELPGIWDPNKTGIPGFNMLKLPGPARPTGAQGFGVDPQVTAATIQYIQQPHPRPFVLVSSLINPHDIGLYPGHPEYFASLPPGRLPPLNRGFKIVNPEPPVVESFRKNNTITRLWTDNDWRTFRAMYYRIVEKVDAEIGKILDATTQAGLDNNTIIIFTSDHGEMMGAHHHVHKNVFYNESMRVPLIVSIPGITDRPLSNRLYTSGLDILPTMLDYADIPLSSTFEGRSLRPLIEQQPVSWRGVLFGETGATHHGRMVLTSRYKYIVYSTSGRNPEQLFNLYADPMESTNLIADPSMRDVLLSHRSRLKSWMAKTNDWFVLPPGT